MQLIGMLDSPYVRRVAISMHCLGIAFEHRPLSVFRQFEQVAAINPVVKVPTLVCDDGTVLMDSTLILMYVERLEGVARPLMPQDRAAHQRALRTLGLALAACEKSVQLLYEREQRPAEKRHEPWSLRVQRQIAGAFGELERWIARWPLAAGMDDIDQAGITAAVAWRFAREVIADAVDPAAFPVLAAHSARAETLPAFVAAPFD